MADKEKAGTGKIPAGLEISAPKAYDIGLPSATEIAALVLAQRFGISAPLAKCVVELASLGGRLA